MQKNIIGFFAVLWYNCFKRGGVTMDISIKQINKV